MTCAHEPEDRMPWEPTTCRHCYAEIEAVQCKRCGNGVAHWMEVGAAAVPTCDTTGEQGWRKA